MNNFSSFIVGQETNAVFIYHSMAPSAAELSQAMQNFLLKALTLLAPASYTSKM